MSGSCFADVLSGYIRLSPTESSVLARIEERQRFVRKSAFLQRGDESGNDVFVLRQGLVMSYVLLADGSRQILRFHFKGDMMGMASLAYLDAPETLCAVSDCIVCPIEKTTLSMLTRDHPRLAAMVMVLCQVDRVVLTDRLASLGRNPAKARVGALLLELQDRLSAADQAGTQGFVLGLTQEEIGDATGLTSVHVNRMLRQLEDEGLIARHNGQVMIRDADALRRSTSYVNRYAGLDLSWLPPAR